MQDKPFGAALLEVAGRTLAEEVLPHLAGRQRYVALMVANAIGVVAREIEAGASLAGAWERALTGLEGAEAEEQAAQLVAAIRAGRYDAETGLHAALVETASIAAAIWKPERR